MTIAILGAGAMGSAVGRRLVSHGAVVPTSLDGRSAATLRRAEAAGMVAATAAQIAEADLILSIVPPAEALGTALRLAPFLAARHKTPVFIDCNAVSPATMHEVAEAFAGSGAAVLDGCIIGAPPVDGGRGPSFYVSGDAAHRCAVLADYGLDLRRIEGPVGAASALKMSYAGITKGLTALGAAMLLAARRNGCAEALRSELAESQPQLLARFEKALPDMVPKAYRWVAEMHEIAAFMGPDDPAAGIYAAAAGLYARIAADAAGEGRLTAAFSDFFEPDGHGATRQG
jgi:3-hydroxyisobutyrate dehydrogenase-like beta-hydroxyacid dehydrogenase